MKTKLRILVALTAFGSSFHAFADSANINYRHQYEDQSKQHSDRVKLMYQMTDSWGFESEIKYKTAGGRDNVAYDNMVSNGTEFIVSYTFRLSPQSTLVPAYQMESTEDATTYKAGLKYNYKINDEFYVAGRYRYDLRKLDRDKQKAHYDDQVINRFEGWLGYTPTDSKLAYEFNAIYYDTNYIRYDNKESDYELNLAVKYKLDKKWQPFMEVGDIKVDPYTDQRQVRWRAGIQYNFM